MLVFLDIDGVLNQLQRNYFVDENCVKELSKLTKTVVLVSTWKYGWCRDLNRCTPQIVNLVRMFDKYGIQIVGRTKDSACRDEECKLYAREHGVNGGYLILDDDASLYQDTARLFLVNPKTGFTGIPKRILKKYR